MAGLMVGGVILLLCCGHGYEVGYQATRVEHTFLARAECLLLVFDQKLKANKTIGYLL